jgi:hypothetical protein
LSRQQLRADYSAISGEHEKGIQFAVGEDFGSGAADCRGLSDCIEQLFYIDLMFLLERNPVLFTLQYHCISFLEAEGVAQLGRNGKGQFPIIFCQGHFDSVAVFHIDGTPFAVVPPAYVVT